MIGWSLRTHIRKIIVIAIALAMCVAIVISLYLRAPISEVDETIEEGYEFLKENLWDEAEGAYRECPPRSAGLENNYWGDDNYLALIIHSDCERFEDHDKVSRIQQFLEKNPPKLELGRKRWCVLSADNYAQYQPTNSLEYADHVALDGIYYAKMGQVDWAEQKFINLVKNMSGNGLIEDEATPQSGHEYYKLALTLILAHHLKEESAEAREYIPALTQKLLDLQELGGSWLTDDKDPETTYPNTETTILILMALNGET